MQLRLLRQQIAETLWGRRAGNDGAELLIFVTDRSASADAGIPKSSNHDHHNNDHIHVSRAPAAVHQRRHDCRCRPGRALGAGYAADANSKVWMCKYVGKPGVDEVLKGGKNPIEVSGHSADKDKDGQVFVGDQFADAQLVFVL
jgi:hypothetical protein